MIQRTAVLGMLLAGSLAFGGCVEEGAAAEGSFDRTLSVSGRVDLEVTTGSGDLRVRTGSAAAVRISALIKARSDGAASGDEKVRYLMANPPIEQAGNVVRIGRIEDRRYSNNVSISYEIVVPADTRLTGRTGSGDLSAEGLSGPAEVSSGSGDITLSGIGGGAKARTGSGNITLSSINGSVAANTGSGDIRGSGIAGGLDAATGSGSVRAQLAAPGDVEVSTGSGTVEVSGVRGSVSVRAGSGDITVAGEPVGSWKAHSSSGDIAVRLQSNAAFTLDSRTSSGKVTVNHPLTIQGTVSAKEMHGNVRGGGPLLELRTGSGNILVE